MQLSENFALVEFTRSDAADRLGLVNYPSAAHLINLTVLAETLEEVRALGSGAIHIMSGYRAPKVNQAVGGVKNSDHASGYAADIWRDGQTPLALAKSIAAAKHIEFDQCILEGSRGVVHFSVAPRMRRQVLRQPGGPGSQVFVGLE